MIQINSAFDFKEHAMALIFHYTQNRRVALTRETAVSIATTPVDVPRNAWLNELCVLCIQQSNNLAIGLQAGNCTAQTCSSMRASEWQFLCAAHDPPKDCAAIDYTTHTLNWAADVVSRRNFAKTFNTSDDSITEEQTANIKQIANIFRRLYRIFVHAWFEHSEVFWEVENNTGLYKLFKTVCDMYDLLPQEAFQLPPEAEGLDTTVERQASHSVLSKSSTPGMLNVVSNIASTSTGLGAAEETGNSSLIRTNTRRHIRSARSTGYVSTVPAVEEDEAEEHDNQNVRNGRSAMNTSSQSADDASQTHALEPAGPDKYDVVAD